MRRPDFTDPYEAARVSSFMEPAECGRWKIIRFTITERHALFSYVHAMQEGESPGERQMRAQRTIPPGEYLCLQRRGTPEEIADITEGLVLDGHAADGDPLYVPVMSDTPSEIREHGLAFDAVGDVLITGLGLGCIVSALLAKPEVKSITVVEIDRDVIALTGPYYEDEPRVEIVNMDAIAAASKFEDEGRSFDYGWHDIWSHIADRNLDDDSVAEHGISYERMFEAYHHLCDLQEAWGYNEALLMQQHKDDAKERLWAWAEKFLAADDEERVKLLQYFHAIQVLPDLDMGDEIPDELFAFALEHLHVEDSTYVQVQARGGVGKIAEELEKQLESERNHVPEPMARPNEVPEANVAL